MEFVYLDFAAAWAYCTKTGRGGDELKAARDRMQNHADYAVARHLEALALAERFVLCGSVNPNSESAKDIEWIGYEVKTLIAGEIGPGDDPFGDLFAA